MKTMRICAIAAGLLAGASHPVWADPWETGPYGSDANQNTINVLWPGAAPQWHDLANNAGSADQDWSRITVEENRSYEVGIFNATTIFSEETLERFSSDGSTLLQSGQFFERTTWRKVLRWIHTGPGVTQAIKVTGTPTRTASTLYEIAFRETTLYCPRFNNSGGQVSVLIVQRAANEGANACSATAFFYNEAQTVVGTQALFPAGDKWVGVVSLPGVAGLAGQKGAAQIAHTCGMGGIKAKLVALEPATGFSFDTPCTVREF